MVFYALVRLHLEFIVQDMISYMVQIIGSGCVIYGYTNDSVYYHSMKNYKYWSVNAPFCSERTVLCAYSTQIPFVVSHYVIFSLLTSC